MAITASSIEWVDYDPRTYFREYGVWRVSDKSWAVVRDKGSFYGEENYEVLARVDDRKAAIGFIKLLKEQ